MAVLHGFYCIFIEIDTLIMYSLIFQLYYSGRSTSSICTCKTRFGSTQPLFMSSKTVIISNIHVCAWYVEYDTQIYIEHTSAEHVDFIFP